MPTQTLDSPIEELLSISQERRGTIQQIVYCGTTGETPKSNGEILQSIKQEIKTQREFAYAMYLWGCAKSYDPKSAGDDDDINDVDNMDVDIDNPLAI